MRQWTGRSLPNHLAVEVSRARTHAAALTGESQLDEQDVLSASDKSLMAFRCSSREDGGNKYRLCFFLEDQCTPHFLLVSPFHRSEQVLRDWQLQLSGMQLPICAPHFGSHGYHHMMHTIITDVWMDTF